MQQPRVVSGVRLLAGLALLVALAGCESGARQDPLLVRGSTSDIVFADMPIFRDRPLDESIRSSLELTDYAVALHKAGLLDSLREAGPFTVFAVPNQPLEAEQGLTGGQLLSGQGHAGLRRLMAYTIVRGRYGEARLRRMIAKRRGPVALPTLDPGSVLTVSREPATGELLLSDAEGRTNRLWLLDVPQSNGVLYATQSLLSPQRLAASAPAAR